MNSLTWFSRMCIHALGQMYDKWMWNLISANKSVSRAQKLKKDHMTSELSDLGFIGIKLTATKHSLKTAETTVERQNPATVAITSVCCTPPPPPRKTHSHKHRITSTLAANLDTHWIHVLPPSTCPVSKTLGWSTLTTPPGAGARGGGGGTSRRPRAAGGVGGGRPFKGAPSACRSVRHRSSPPVNDHLGRSAVTSREDQEMVRAWPEQWDREIAPVDTAARPVPPAAARRPPAARRTTGEMEMCDHYRVVIAGKQCAYSVCRMGGHVLTETEIRDDFICAVRTDMGPHFIKDKMSFDRDKRKMRCKYSLLLVELGGVLDNPSKICYRIANWFKKAA